MKYDADARRVELTTRNLQALNDKLDDARSARTIGSPCGLVRVRAVEGADRTAAQAHAAAAEGMVLVTRGELAAMLSGETVIVAGIEVVPVPDATHYTARPAGDVIMPSTGERRRGVLAMVLRHICEVCGIEEVLTPDQAYEAGWDYPPRQGRFGVISPRVCPGCPSTATVWWALTCDGYTQEMLSDRQRDVVARILAEPGVDHGGAAVNEPITPRDRPGWQACIDRLVDDLAEVEPDAEVQMIDATILGPKTVFTATTDAGRVLIWATLAELAHTCGRCGKVEPERITWCAQCGEKQR